MVIYIVQVGEVTPCPEAVIPHLVDDDGSIETTDSKADWNFWAEHDTKEADDDNSSVRTTDSKGSIKTTDSEADWNYWCEQDAKDEVHIFAESVDGDGSIETTDSEGSTKTTDSEADWNYWCEQDAKDEVHIFAESVDGDGSIETTDSEADWNWWLEHDAKEEARMIAERRERYDSRLPYPFKASLQPQFNSSFDLRDSPTTILITPSCSATYISPLTNDPKDSSTSISIAPSCSATNISQLTKDRLPENVHKLAPPSNSKRRPDPPGRISRDLYDTPAEKFRSDMRPTLCPTISYNSTVAALDLACTNKQTKRFLIS